jgi:hypothetical protein
VSGLMRSLTIEDGERLYSGEMLRRRDWSHA